MKISKIFHWLYFTVMMLPCVIIPIFAIYTRNENYNSNIEVQQSFDKQVDFNQLFDETQLQSKNNLTLSVYDSGAVKIQGTASVDTYWNSLFAIPQERFGHIFLYKMFPYDGTKYFAYLESPFQGINNSLRIQLDTNRQLTWKVFSGNQVDFTFYPQIFDLTQMFGAGNEPTEVQFNTYFPNTYYPYVESETKVIENYETITYNDTDVGSQFVYTLYNATDKYFNFDNFFGLNNVYSWIQLNWFSGNAPLGFAIFWHFFTYWLLASLAWLLFDVMIYVPLMIHRWMDKGAIE